jgi:hypothetical protein
MIFSICHKEMSKFAIRFFQVFLVGFEIGFIAATRRSATGITRSRWLGVQLSVSAVLTDQHRVCVYWLND